jgi:negative regulator of flagellin synthesis FlgM
MEIRNNAEVLKNLLGVGSSTSTQGAQTEAAKSGDKTQAAVLGGDKATVSALGAEVAQASDSDVRLDKVASVQSTLAEGTYQVPASAVAGKVVDSMLMQAMESSS